MTSQRHMTDSDPFAVSCIIADPQVQCTLGVNWKLIRPFCHCTWKVAGVGDRTSTRYPIVDFSYGHHNLDVRKLHAPVCCFTLFHVTAPPAIANRPICNPVTGLCHLWSAECEC